MKIMQSLKEVSKNSSNFKQWEVEQDNTDIKRNKLAEQSPPSKEELKRAQDFGKTIIDVVNIMDQHSEDIAENVETATTIPMGLIPLASFFLSALASVKFIFKPAEKKYEAIKKEFFEVNGDKIKDLRERIKVEIPEKEHWKIDYHILDENYIKRLKVSGSIKQDAHALIKEFNPKVRSIKGNIILGGIIPIATLIGTFIGGNIYATKLQIGSSKVARFQGRKVLNDPKYFVNYTPEQIEQAKQNLEANKSKKSKKNKLKIDKLKNGMFRGTASIIKDNKEYQEWKKSDDAKPEKIERPLTKEELEQAQKDKEVIQRVVRKINNNAETYSENMEVASAVLIGGTPVLGFFVGKFVSFFMNATKIIPNTVKKLVDKYGDESAKNSYKELTAANKETPNKLKLFLDFADDMMCSNTKEIEKLSKLEKFKLASKKLLAVGLSTKKGSNWSLGLVSALATSIVGVFIGLKLQKSSARAGRYEAKQELEKDPKNFIGYTDNELNSVKDFTRSKKHSLKEYLLFVPKEISQYLKYKKYTKTELKQNNLLQEELTKLDVSNEQLQDAKNLQRKIFNTFEQVDDKSQDYSESVEAACEIAQPFVYAGAIILSLTPVSVFLVRTLQGKTTIKTIITKLINILNKSTKIMQKKFFKNYLDDVSSQISGQVKSTFIPSYIKYPTKSTQRDFEEFNKTKDIVEGLYEFSKTEVANIPQIKSMANKTLELIKPEIDKMPEQELKEVINNFANKIESPVSFIDLDFESIDKKYIMENIPKIQTIINNIPDKEIKNILDGIMKEYEEHPDELVASISNGSILKAFATPKLAVAAGAIGAGWFAINMLIGFTIESILANIQLKAGRLGVMKALESLEDPAYYANSEPKNPMKEIKAKNLLSVS